MKILFKDFYKQTRTIKKNIDTIFGRFEKEEPAKENLTQLIERVNDWIFEHGLNVLNVETLYAKSSEQFVEFIRVWYTEPQLEVEEVKIQTNIEKSSVQTQTDFEQTVIEKKSDVLLDFF